MFSKPLDLLEKNSNFHFQGGISLPKISLTMLLYRLELNYIIFLYFFELNLDINTTI